MTNEIIKCNIRKGVLPKELDWQHPLNLTQRDMPNLMSDELLEKSPSELLSPEGNISTMKKTKGLSP